MSDNIYLPQLARVAYIKEEVVGERSIKTFRVEAVDGKLFADPSAADQKLLKKTHDDAVAYPQRKINDPDGAPAKLKASFNSPLWQEMA